MLRSLIFLLLAGCISPVVIVHDIPPLRIVQTDILTLNKVCGGADGCYFPESKEIYILERDWETLGHELCHVMYEDAEHKKECSQWGLLKDHTKGG